MKSLLLPILFALALMPGCAPSRGGELPKKDPSSPAINDATPNNASTSTTALPNSFPVIHVFVALCDNVNQGIVPVSASLGNGDNPATNLYWGAGEAVKIKSGAKTIEINTGGSAELVAYVGHNGLMDFALQATPQARDERHRKAIILACISKKYFAAPLKSTGAEPLLWTTNLMAPEAYILSAAIDGWLKNETDEQIRLRAAKAYNSYQKCGLKSANNLFATGW